MIWTTHLSLLPHDFVTAFTITLILQCIVMVLLLVVMRENEGMGEESIALHRIARRKELGNSSLLR
jgi:hypothetical protein